MVPVEKSNANAFPKKTTGNPIFHPTPKISGITIGRISEKKPVWPNEKMYLAIPTYSYSSKKTELYLIIKNNLVIINTAKIITINLCSFKELNFDFTFILTKIWFILIIVTYYVSKIVLAYNTFVNLLINNNCRHISYVIFCFKHQNRRFI